jgi:hypothetical protein
VDTDLERKHAYRPANVDHGLAHLLLLLGQSTAGGRIPRAPVSHHDALKRTGGLFLGLQAVPELKWRRPAGRCVDDPVNLSEIM